MNNEIESTDLNDALYEKMSVEMEEYRNDLLSMSPEEMLEHAAGYVTRQDILLSLEHNPVSQKQAAALLRMENALDEVTLGWEQAENSYMEDVQEMIESTANSIIRFEFLREIRDKDGR